MPAKVGMVSLGCSKNQVDAEMLLALVREGGYELCADAAECDVVIINTCGFIDDAKKESIDNILEFAQLKEEGRIKAIVVTGCLAERYREEMAKELPEADVILGIGRNKDIASAIQKALSGEKVVEFGGKDELSISGERILANEPYFAYLKVAEGCDNRCTYCAIPLIRGNFRSRPIEDVLEEAQKLADWGVTEINVVAQDTTRYGEDLYGKLMLPELLRRLCRIEGLHWVRVLYCYPERVTDEFLEVMATEPKVVKYVDIPIQHADGTVLRRMNRRGDLQQLTDLMKKIRATVPDVVLRTTLITGFPGETNEQFASLCEFVDEVQFDRLGCFTYSQEEDTPAAKMPEQLEEETKQRRAEIIMERQMQIAQNINQKHVGRVLEVLVEGFDTYAESWYGRSYMDAPDIDTKVFFSTQAPVKQGDYVQVQIEEFLDYDLVGTIYNQGGELL